MPSMHGSNRAAISHDIEEMRRAGHPRAQAVATSYREAGEDECWRDRFVAAVDLAYGEDDKDDFYDRLMLALFETQADDELATAPNGGVAVGVKQAHDALAFDRASVRTFDDNGHLRVERTPISKAVVSEYLGSEIPGFKELGIDPAKIYKLYRHPDELAKGAKGFVGKPILLEHKPVSADEHPRELTVGSIGEPVEMDGDTLYAPLNIWDAEAIKGIESERQKSLSCGYRYQPEMTPGRSPEGEPYDGIMRAIDANHLALVTEPRVPGAVVADSAENLNPSNAQGQNMKTKPLSQKAALAQGAVFAFLRPMLAQDAKIDLKPIFADITAKNFSARKGKLAHDIKKAVGGKLAQDASIDGLAKLLDSVGEEKAVDEDAPIATAPKIGDEGMEDVPVIDAGPGAKIKEFLAGKLSDEDMAKLDELLQMIGNAGAEHEAAESAGADEEGPEGEETPEEKETEKKDMVTKGAMDAAVKAATRAASVDAEKNVMARLQGIREAERAVRPLLGDVSLGLDSASAIYAAALKAEGVKVDGVDPSAYPALVSMAIDKKSAIAKSAHRHDAPAQAMDAAAIDSFGKMFPDAMRIEI